ncbi:MAG TPA: bifunctional diaminohydroxyphosphoribosylaminopyrimidine deaminase/5-amino-6-(5-phosphoribosylamino)uracil reductase RibD [Sphingobacterium sp.]|nr:bifunctional diaminohydroxyphosphoribosylaminopyrimidine deaminase/5-amino-6-(5-phosphoribosylamino)uracil reductase RibD [Sphingobacterium sp.]
MNPHEKYMQRCLDLALQAQAHVSPNPMVGAVIVVEDKIIGEGYTSPYGGPHAEVNAVQDVLTKYGENTGSELLQRSTAYVSLEPCAHYGKTPPCADMLISYSIPKIVIGCKDPFAKVNGLGIKKLQEAGADIITDVLEEECQDLNRRFFTRIGKHRPYVILKWAQTADGYFAPNEAKQKWISNAASKQLVHKWRSEEDAILVGKNTALIDNPSLNTRLWQGKSPKRILIDKNLDIPPDHTIFSDDGTEVLVFNALKTDWQGNKKQIAMENFDLYLPQTILYQLYLMDIQSIIIEGGLKTLDMFIKNGLWDEARIFVGPMTWSEGIKAPHIDESTLVSSQQVSTDKLYIYKNRN